MSNVDTQHRSRRPQASAGGGSPVYGLGFVGALVWFWRRADTPRDRLMAVGKASVWPAFLVYHALQALAADHPIGSS